MNRILAVPLAVEGVTRYGPERHLRRILKSDDHEDIEIVRKLAENSKLINSMMSDLESEPDIDDSPEASTELDYIKTSIQLGLLEITGELEEIPYSDELLEEAAV